MAIAQSYLAALARDWDGKLARLQRSLDASAPRSEGCSGPGRTGGIICAAGTGLRSRARQGIAT